MNVLIVEEDPDLGRLWKNHLSRSGASVDLAKDEAMAITFLETKQFDILVVNVDLVNGSALTVADIANYRCPDAQVIFVTNSSFFSDGSIFSVASNARAVVTAATKPEDLAAMVEHYAAVR